MKTKSKIANDEREGERKKGGGEKQGGERERRKEYKKWGGGGGRSEQRLGGCALDWFIKLLSLGCSVTVHPDTHQVAQIII